MKKTLSFILVLIPLAVGVVLVNKVFWNQLFASESYSTSLDDKQANAIEFGGNIQVALCLDVSGSMSGLIDQTKGRLWDIVNELSNAKMDGKPTQLEIALYIYGSPMLGAEHGYTKQLTPFTTDLDLISEELFALGTSGGDEYCGQVIDEAIKNLNWSQDKKDLKMVFVAGNESFAQGPVSYEKSIGNAQEKNIVVNTIFCGNIVQGRQMSWEHGAKLGLGEYMNIDHNQAVTHISTPYDQEIQTYNSRLNDTYVYYGDEGYLNKTRQETQDKNANKFGTANSVKRAKSKVSKSYWNSKWDLVDATEEKSFQWKDVDKKTLDPKLQKLSEEELKAEIKKKSDERAKLKKEINELYKKREEYVKEQKKKTSATSLDEVMINTIRKQGEANGMSFKKQ
ncbi:MAG: hypothetical protein MRZ79_10610 [Bacteroidia bacterium]|nr:hypothetical protein [Bacteroidia bacterium]